MRSLRNKIALSKKIAESLMGAGFEAFPKRCENCGKRRSYHRKEENWCWSCGYGQLWPTTKEEALLRWLFK